MLKYLPLLFVLSLSQIASAKKVIAFGAYMIKSEEDNSISEDKSVYKFNFVSINDNEKNRVVRYSIDGEESKVTLDEKKSFEIMTTPGKHVFMLFYNKGYTEVITDSLAIKAQFRNTYNVYMMKVMEEVQDVIVFKPIIYLYPEKEKEVTVELDIKGEEPFYYPEYENGWKCTAKPNGEITIGDDTYNYLFWEATEKDHLERNTLTEGFYVAGNNAMAFLEEKLTVAGFTSKEKADFITFWGPRIQSNQHNLVQFDFNETCDEYADLNITPKPDNIYRIYIKIAPLDVKINTNGQEIKTVDRTGFTVIEWGGQLSNPITINNINL